MPLDPSELNRDQSYQSVTPFVNRVIGSPKPQDLNSLLVGKEQATRVDEARKKNIQLQDRTNKVTIADDMEKSPPFETPASGSRHPDLTDFTHQSKDQLEHNVVFLDQ